MNWLTFGVQWFHILLGILRFGNSLVLAVFTIPALNRLPIPVQRQFGQEYGARTQRVFDLAVPARDRRRLLVTLAAALAVFAAATPATATPPDAVTIDTLKQLGPSEGAWTASGAFSDSGSFVTVDASFSASGAPAFHVLVVTYRFTGTGGTFDIHAVIKEGPTENPDIWYSDGTWRVVGGTGEYESLHGHGRVTGVVDNTDPNFRFADRVYAGEAHFD